MNVALLVALWFATFYALVCWAMWKWIFKPWSDDLDRRWKELEERRRKLNSRE